MVTAIERKAELVSLLGWASAFAPKRPFRRYASKRDLHLS